MARARRKKLLSVAELKKLLELRETFRSLMVDPAEQIARRARRMDFMGRFLASRGIVEQTFDEVCDFAGQDEEWLFDEAVLQQDGWTEKDGVWIPPPQELTDPPPEDVELLRKGAPRP